MLLSIHFSENQECGYGYEEGMGQSGLSTVFIWAEIMNSSEAQRQPEKYPGKEKHMPKSVVQKSYFMPDFREC